MPKHIVLKPDVLDLFNKARAKFLKETHNGRYYDNDILRLVLKNYLEGK